MLQLIIQLRIPPICGFPKIRGPLLGVPPIRTVLLWGPYCCPPIYGNYQVEGQGSHQPHLRPVFTRTLRPVGIWVDASDLRHLPAYARQLRKFIFFNIRVTLKKTRHPEETNECAEGVDANPDLFIHFACQPGNRTPSRWQLDELSHGYCLQVMPTPFLLPWLFRGLERGSMSCCYEKQPKADHMRWNSPNIQDSSEPKSPPQDQGSTHLALGSRPDRP